MKDLTTNPSKMSQPAGAALAFMGVKGMIPLWHGVQGCTAFAKVMFITHFREPMPFQNTAISQTNVIMGGDQNILEALDNVKHQAEIVGLITTGVSETSGIDLKSTLNDYLKKDPAYNVIYLNTPDFEGNLETGYTRATELLLKTQVKPKSKVDAKQIAVFPGPYFTPGEIEELRDIISDFNLNPIFCPDLGDSLYGYLKERRFSPCSSGGVELDKLKKLSNSSLVLSLGTSTESLAMKFGETHNIPVLNYKNLTILEEIDHFFQTLSWISGEEVPKKYKKRRQHYLDTLLDTEYCFRGKKVAIAGDLEFITRWKDPLSMLEIENMGLSNRSGQNIDEGDFSDFTKLIIEQDIDFVVGNSHIATIAEELKIPVIRSGIPVTDRFGEPQSVRIGYVGASRILNECANAALKAHKHVSPYVSPLTATLV